VQLHPPQKSVHGYVCSIFFAAAARCSDTRGDANEVWTRNDITKDPQTRRTHISSHKILLWLNEMTEIPRKNGKDSKRDKIWSQRSCLNHNPK
jgi:hypothetical protein